MHPDDIYRGKKYKVMITRTADGEVREYDHGDPFNIWDDGTMYMWSDGNYGCDCNRHLFFYRAKGTEPDEDCECGESAYSAYAVLEDGVKVEFESMFD